jgi:hypothetical protein
MLWLIFAVLLLFWIIGWGFGVAGNLVHALLCWGQIWGARAQSTAAQVDVSKT